MGQIEKIFKIKESSLPNLTTPQRQSFEAVEDFAVKKVIASREIQTGNHNDDGLRPEVVNVCYGTSATPPTASTTPIGTLYIQYTV